jgi:carbon-monoxide dehydrogenase medium subunit
VKPPPFAYRRVEAPEEAVDLLARYGDDAKVLAGGQSLVPMLALRLVRPAVLVDVSRIGSLRHATREGDVLRIGALTRHRDLADAAVGGPDDGYGVVRRAVPLVGHEPIRTRGTFGGSVAHADPAAEWPLLSVLLDAELVAIGPAGERTIPAKRFFLGYFATALEPDELLVEVRFPQPWPGAAMHEHSRRHGDFALVCAATAVEAGAGGRCTSARVALGAVDDKPLRLAEAERVLVGSRLEGEAIAAAADAAAAAIDPPNDVHATSAHRRRLTAVLVRRALTEARERAGIPVAA